MDIIIELVVREENKQKLDDMMTREGVEKPVDLLNRGLQVLHDRHQSSVGGDAVRLMQRVFGFRPATSTKPKLTVAK